MPYRDLRAYLRWLEEEGQLTRVAGPVSTRFEIARHEAREDGRRAVFFERVRGHAMPVVANVFNRRANVAHVLGVPPTEALNERIIEAARHPIPTRLAGDGPVKEVRVTGSDVDLIGQLPNPMHFEKDAGHYISSGVIVARDAESGARNLSFARMLVRDGRNFVIMVNF